MKPDLSPVAVSRETAERLTAYAGLIQHWSPTINLVARNDLPDLLHRHIDDSLQLLPLLPRDAGIHLDLGSGAGLPGLVLAIARDRPVHLVESDRRKAEFLRHAARTCGVAATVHATRIEQASLPPADVITSRALAPLTRLLELATPHLAAHGVCIFPKGRSAEAELTHAIQRWQMQVRRWTSRTDPHATILELSEITRR